MVPSAEEEVAKGYTHEPPWPFVKDLVGHPPHHRNAYEVGGRPCDCDFLVADFLETNSYGNCMKKSAICVNPIWITGMPPQRRRAQGGL